MGNSTERTPAFSIYAHSSPPWQGDTKFKRFYPFYSGFSVVIGYRRNGKWMLYLNIKTPCCTNEMGVDYVLYLNNADIIFDANIYIF